MGSRARLDARRTIARLLVRSLGQHSICGRRSDGDGATAEAERLTTSPLPDERADSRARDGKIYLRARTARRRRAVDARCERQRSARDEGPRRRALAGDLARRRRVSPTSRSPTARASCTCARSTAARTASRSPTRASKHPAWSPVGRSPLVDGDRAARRRVRHATRRTIRESRQRASRRVGVESRRKDDRACGHSARTMASRRSATTAIPIAPAIATPISSPRRTESCGRSTRRRRPISNLPSSVGTDSAERTRRHATPTRSINCGIARPSLYYSAPDAAARRAQWETLKTKYRPRALAAKTDDELKTVIHEMLREHPPYRTVRDGSRGGVERASGRDGGGRRDAREGRQRRRRGGRGVVRARRRRAGCERPGRLRSDARLSKKAWIVRS